MAASVWKGYLSFGLVSFPVRLFAAARPEAVHFHMLHKKDLSRIKEVWYCAEEDKPVDRADIVKGYEYSKGKYVVVEPEELKKISPPTARAMEILQFVRASDVDPIYFEHSYYVAPEEGVRKPYALLLRAMQETEYDAIAKVTMHGREHVVVIRPTPAGIVLHTMYYVAELHKSRETGTGDAQYSRKELDLAKKLIESLGAPFKPEQFHDQYRQNVERLVEEKQHGRKVTVEKPARVAPVVDILQALQRSLSSSSKTAKSGSTQVSKTQPAKKTAKKRPRHAA
ncbi:MAG TPA: Ku protein [Bryobacteraceae bacterium]|nr:Ku protein [Bryobacteraceae bacterium]